jgi:hypothetical protein
MDSNKHIDNYRISNLNQLDNSNTVSTTDNSSFFLKESFDFSFKSVLNFSRQNSVQKNESIFLNLKFNFSFIQNFSAFSGSVNQSEDNFKRSIPDDLRMVLRLISKDSEEFKQLEKKFCSMFNQVENVCSSKTSPVQEKENINLSGIVSLQAGIEINIKSVHISENRADNPISVSGNFGFSLFFEQETLTSQADPLVLELIEQAEGVWFDIKGNNSKVKVSWVNCDDAFLCLDKNSNGIIDSGKEMFGDQNGSSNGFIELSLYDDDDNNFIDNKDKIYSRLLIWKDKNSDGISQENELSGLKEQGVKSINLNYTKVNEEIKGNTIYEKSTFENFKAQNFSIADVWLRYGIT